MMSFILDALRKAEAERSLAHLPGLHAAQTAAIALPSMRSGWRRRQVWLAIAIGVALIVGLLGWQFGTDRHSIAPTTRLPATSMRTGLATAAPASTLPTVPVPLPARALLPAPAAAPASELPVPKAVQTPRKAPVLQGGPMLLPSKKSSPATTSVPVMALADLPPAIQREIPPLAFSGSMYSTNAADRMVLLDKRMLHEGDEVAPGLTLDRVLPKGAILRYKGHVFQVKY